MSDKAENAWEHADETIREDWSQYVEWVDRGLPETQPCADNMPRVVGSNSWYSEELQYRYNARTRKLTARGTAVKPGTMTKRDVKKYALFNALEVLNPPVMNQIKDQILATRSSFLTREKRDFSQIKF